MVFRKRSYFSSWLAFLLLVGCFSNKSNDSERNSPPPDMHTSRISLDWPGSYIGVFPCVECNDVFYSIELGENQKYRFQQFDLEGEKPIVSDKGEFTWIHGDGAVKLREHETFQVQEFALMQEVIDLVGDGRPREVRFPKVDVGPLAKQTPSDIVGDWKVIARYRKDGSMVDTVFSTLSFTDGGKFRGKAACNTYSGSFEVPATQRVDFSTIARTKMYCSDIAAEQVYFEVLEQLAYYYRVGESLILLSADLRPLVLAVGIVK